MKYKTLSGKGFLALPLRGRAGFSLLSIFSILSNGDDDKDNLVSKFANLSEKDQIKIEDKFKKIILQQNNKLKEKDIVVDGYLDIDITTMMNLFAVYQGQQEDKKK